MKLTRFGGCAFSALLLMALSQSCRPVMYFPNSQNVPMFQAKNDLQLKGSYQNYQLAYAPSKNIGLLVNGHFKNTTPYGYDEGAGKSIQVEEAVSKGLEGGIGYFENNKIINFEVFAGAGGGLCSFRYYYDPYINDSYYDASVRYDKIFIQPDVNWKYKILQTAFAIRVSYLKFKDFSDSYGRPFYEKSDAFFIEPSMTIKLNLRYVSFQAQGQLSMVNNTTPDGLEPLYELYQSRPRLHGALVINVGEFFKKKN